jgi:hypothetical protein
MNRHSGFPVICWQMASRHGKREKQYAQSGLEEAVRLIQEKQISLSQASLKYNIPKGTLHNKIHGKTPLQCKKGPKTLLSSAEETKISNWIINMAKIGYPVNASDVRETVAMICEIKGQKDLKPGKKWMRLFLNRHPHISKRHAEVISKARASITEPIIRKWFNVLHQHLQEENAGDILEDPKRIFNLDETGVQLCPKTGVILAPKNYRAMYDVASGQEKQCITVLCNFSANGETVPPFIVYPLQRISKEVAQSVPNDWGIGRSESGWMTGQTFFEYIKELFVPCLQKNEITLPVLLLVDGHKSHINLDLHEFCVKNKIILYCLHPNTTHILQPCDVGIFGPLKAAWKTAVRKHKIKNNVQITRSNFAKLFAEAFESSVTKGIICNAFKACGLFPFDPNSVNYSKCISNRKEEIANVISLQEYNITIDVIEKTLPKNILERYKEYRRCNKKVKSSLFKFWTKCKNKVENALLSKSSNIDDSLKENSKPDSSNSRVVTNKEGELAALIIDQNESITIGTNTLIEGIMDVESMPIEIEGVSLLPDEVFEDIATYVLPEQQDIQPLIPECTANTTETRDNSIPINWTEPGTTSTPISSRIAIPLPWYTETDLKIQNLECPVNAQTNPGTSKILDAFSPHIDEPHVEDSFDLTNTKIDELLRLPGGKNATKRKLTKSPVPLAITSKKFKEYLEQKENVKKKKAEDIMYRKRLREQKKAEREKKKENTIKRRKTKANDKDKKNRTEIKTLETKIPIVRKSTLSDLPIARESNNIELTKESNENVTLPIKNLDKKNINFGDYVVVKFETNKRNRYYVGQVLMYDYEYNFLKVKCLRKKCSKLDDLTYFVEPSTIDLTEVSLSDVQTILPSPRIGRRGMITFDIPQFDVNMCE